MLAQSIVVEVHRRSHSTQRFGNVPTCKVLDCGRSPSNVFKLNPTDLTDVDDDEDDEQRAIEVESRLVSTYSYETRRVADSFRQKMVELIVTLSSTLSTSLRELAERLDYNQYYSRHDGRIAQTKTYGHRLSLVGCATISVSSLLQMPTTATPRSAYCTPVAAMSAAASSARVPRLSTVDED